MDDDWKKSLDCLEAEEGDGSDVDAICEAIEERDREILRLSYELGRSHKTVAMFEGAVCAPGNLLAVHGGVDTLALNTEKVMDVMRERDLFRTVATAHWMNDVSEYFAALRQADCPMNKEGRFHKNEIYFIHTAMRKYGGSFVKVLGDMVKMGDDDNAERIRLMWPEYWNKYGLMGMKLYEEENKKDGD